MKRVFGFLEHLFFYLIFVFAILFIIFNSIIFIYLIILCWIVSSISHIIESIYDRKSWKKIIFG